MQDAAWHQPPALRAGDTIAIISPSGPVQPQHLEEGLSILRQWGLRPLLHDHVYDRHKDGYLAGDDATRLNALTWAYEHEDVRAILCARGGYGAMRLLPALTSWVDQLNASPKMLIGFSDITALHLFLASQCKQISVHGPVLKSFGMLQRDEHHRSLDQLHALMFGTAPHTVMTQLRTIRPGHASGRLIGGNLSLVASLVGSPYCPPLQDKLLFLEDVTECDYRLDRLLTTLTLTQNHPAGLILGDFTECGGVYVAEVDIDDYLATLTGQWPCPVVAGAPIGHAHRNVAVLHGANATLNASEGTLHIHNTEP